MGWLADRTGIKGNKTNPRQPASQMTAAGMRINLQDRNVVNTIAATKMGWQTVAWNYRDLIGEMASALRFRGNALAKVALVIGQVNDLEDEPIRLDADNCTLDPIVAQAAQDALSRLPWRNGAAFATKIDTGMSIAGEAWLHGKTNPLTGQEQWMVRSTDEIQPVGGAASLGVVEVPGRPAVPIDKDKEALLRLWNPHPRYSMLSDSPIRSMFDVLEDIVLIGREIRAAARSRISANGVWMIPNSMSLARATPGASDEDSEADTFAASLEAAMMAPIANEGDPGGVVPIILRGDAEDIEAAAKGFMRFDRETSADLISKLDNALKRMGETLDIPPTVVTGLQDTNHWNAYVIDDQTWDNHLEPGERLIVDSLTEGFLRPILQLPPGKGGYGLSLEQAQQVQVWYDATAVTRNPNRSADAVQAYGLGVIGPKPVREAMGFEESDAPTEEELKIMIALKVNPDPATAGLLVQQALGLPAPVVPAPETGQAPNGAPVAAQPARTAISGPKGAQPPSARLPAGQASVPSQTRTGMPAAPVRGAGDPQRVLDSEPPIRLMTGQSLINLDRRLRERLLDAADQAVTSAVDKAAKRVISAAQHKIDAAVLAEHRGADLALHLGPDGVAALGLTEDTLLSAAFAYLYEKFMAWTLGTIADAVKVAVKTFALELHAAASLRNVLAGRRQKAWHRFEGAMRQRAMDKLYGRGGTEDHVGETVDGIVMPGDVRTALAEIGGEQVLDGGRTFSQPLGGIASGPDMLGAVGRKMTQLGFLWEYGITDGRRHAHFEPHLELDGRKFTGWDDPALKPSKGYEWVGDHFKPGDHRGCLCDHVPVWAIDERAERVRQQLNEPESPSMAGDRLLSGLDNAAGRSGTTAQRSVAQREEMLAVQRRWLSNAEKAGSRS